MYINVAVELWVSMGSMVVDVSQRLRSVTLAMLLAPRAWIGSRIGDLQTVKAPRQSQAHR